MADSGGTARTSLKSRLLEKGSDFTFFQAYRLLRSFSLQEGRGEENIHVSPELSLSFPENDIQSVEEDLLGYKISANFMGLYGVLSPLPNFYTEDLIDENLLDRKAARQFLDLVNQEIYPNFFKAWLKPRLHLRIAEFDDYRLLQILYSFVGFNEPKKYFGQPGFESLLQFAGIFKQFPQSAVGLRTILNGVYPDIKVSLEQLSERQLDIPVEQRCLLGRQANELGEDAHLGYKIKTRINNITIFLEDVSQSLFAQLQPGGYEFERLSFIVRTFLYTPLNVRVVINLKRGEADQVILGETSWNELGKNTWIHSTPQDQSVQYLINL